MKHISSLAVIKAVSPIPGLLQLQAPSPTSHLPSGSTGVSQSGLAELCLAFLAEGK